MTYRTRKYIFRSVRYVLITSFLTAFYIIAANSRNLPAVFEYYTGDTVREHTSSIYKKWFQQEPSAIADTAHDTSPLLWNTLDFITREPGYIQASNTLDVLKAKADSLHSDSRRENSLQQIATDPALVNWLRNPRGRFADIFKYEFIRNLDRRSFISDYAVFTVNGGSLHTTAGYKPDFRRTETAAYSEEKFTHPVRDEGRIIGYFHGRWNPWQFPDLRTMAGSAGDTITFLINAEHKVLSDIAGRERISRFLEYKQKKSDSHLVYTGPVSGRMYRSRYLSAAGNNITIIAVYPAAGISFYVFRLMLYTIGIAALVYLYIYGRKAYHLLRNRQFTPRRRWLEEGLEEALELNRQTLDLNNTARKVLLTVREKEVETLEKISGHMATTSRKLAGARLAGTATDEPREKLISEPASHDELSSSERDAAPEKQPGHSEIQSSPPAAETAESQHDNADATLSEEPADSRKPAADDKQSRPAEETDDDEIISIKDEEELTGRQMAGPEDNAEGAGNQSLDRRAQISHTSPGQVDDELEKNRRPEAEPQPEKADSDRYRGAAMPPVIILEDKDDEITIIDEIVETEPVTEPEQLPAESAELTAGSNVKEEQQISDEHTGAEIIIVEDEQFTVYEKDPQSGEQKPLHFEAVGKPVVDESPAADESPVVDESPVAESPVADESPVAESPPGSTEDLLNELEIEIDLPDDFDDDIVSLHTDIETPVLNIEKSAPDFLMLEENLEESELTVSETDESIFQLPGEDSMQILGVSSDYVKDTHHEDEEKKEKWLSSDKAQFHDDDLETEEIGDLLSEADFDKLLEQRHEDDITFSHQGTDPTVDDEIEIPIDDEEIDILTDISYDVPAKNSLRDKAEELNVKVTGRDFSYHRKEEIINLVDPSEEVETSENKVEHIDKAGTLYILENLDTRELELSTN